MYLAEVGKVAGVGAAVDEDGAADGVGCVEVPLEQADRAPNANIAMRPSNRVRRRFLM
jgi:hypothetical protein